LNSLDIALLSLLKVNDRPYGVKVLYGNKHVSVTKWKETYISLDVEVLEVEGVFPDINTNDGDEMKEGILVGSGSDLKTLGLGINALRIKFIFIPRTRTNNDVRASPSRSLGWQQWWR